MIGFHHGRVKPLDKLVEACDARGWAFKLGRVPDGFNSRPTWTLDLWSSDGPHEGGHGPDLEALVAATLSEFAEIMKEHGRKES